MKKEVAKELLASLMERFPARMACDTLGDYNETQTRQDFINPFFGALGWDIDNAKRLAEPYREVRQEDRIKVNGHSKAPDYSFNLDGKRQFFVEAKKPSVPIRENPEPALQLRNYGWNAGLSISIVTDFEEFAVYDCTRKPKKTENANAKRLKYIYFTDYLKEFDFLYDTFAYENVVRGSLEKYASAQIDRKAIEPVNVEFLKTLEGWRDYLATNIASRMPALAEEEINQAVQQTIDRLVFLKVCEDRKIEPENTLFRTVQSGNHYQNLLAIFYQADERYNSGLFDFQKDKLSPSLEIDNKVIRNIVWELYGKSKLNEAEFGFNFAYIPVEILGMAYEQFLGKVIRLGSAREALVEDKPEVRKAGGVYYTPEYIVEHIVRETVGRMTLGKNPQQVSRIKILDPSCGSGSFLLGAYQFLLDFHLRYYLENPTKGKRPPLTPDGHLTSQEKKRILLNNIHGVDIDPQAVEVTKLSLLLKALEGETEASIQTSLKLFNERVLPTIDQNIQCGNSLVAPDFYDQGALLSPKEERKINVFDWKQAFPQAFAQGGFDCVLGNPPYVRIQNLDKNTLEYFSRYQSAMGNFDLYCLFVEKGVELLNPAGQLSYILPHRFFKTDYGQGLRNYLAQNRFLRSIFDFDGFYVFDNASINTCVMHLDKAQADEHLDYHRLADHKIPLHDLREFLREPKAADTRLVKGRVLKKTLSAEYWNFVFDDELELFEKLNQNKRLGDWQTKILVGLQTSADPVFITKLVGQTDEHFEVFSKHTGQKHLLEKEILFPLLRGAEVKRYRYPINTDLLIFPYLAENEKAILIDEKTFKKKYPRIWKYLKACKPRLEERDKGKLTYPWYAFGRSQNLASFHKNKIMTTVLSGHNSFTLDLEGKFYFVGGGNAGVYGIQLADKRSYPYLTGLLNSKLLNWYHSKISLRCYQTAFSYGKRFIEQLPIKTIDKKDKGQKALFDKISQLVESLLELNKRAQATHLQVEIDQIQRRTQHLDSQIDALVYELYGLLPHEIALVERQQALPQAEAIAPYLPPNPQHPQP